jgi:BA14K-like protein
MTSKLAMSAAVVGASLMLAAAPAHARWYGHRHHGYSPWGAGIAGFAAGALIGGALAPRPYGYYYGEPAYAYAPDDAEAYCEQRFRSYDPRSGTYLGYDGRRHPCP